MSELLWVVAKILFITVLILLILHTAEYFDDCLVVEDPTQGRTVARAVFIADVVDGEFKNYHCESAVAGDGAPEAPAE